jgi:beta-glucoside operon transcriptional antiterminator
MKVEKVINNNIVSAFDSDHVEVIVMGRGLGFGCKPGQIIPEDKIEKIFRITKSDVARKFEDLLTNMPLEHLQISSDVIEYAKKHLHHELNPSIYVTLTDHIDFVLKRVREGISIENALLLETKTYYENEYEIGRYAIELIEERLHVQLPDDEAGFIALHFVNSEYGENIKDAAKFPNLLKEIIGIIQTDLHKKLDVNSLHYSRLVTHVKFLLQRIYRNELLPDDEMQMIRLMQDKYHREYACSIKIADYLEKETGCRLSDEEIMYMAIHIRRATGEEN